MATLETNDVTRKKSCRVGTPQCIGKAGAALKFQTTVVCAADCTCYFNFGSFSYFT